MTETITQKPNEPQHAAIELTPEMEALVTRVRASLTERPWGVSELARHLFPESVAADSFVSAAIKTLEARGVVFVRGSYRNYFLGPPGTVIAVTGPMLEVFISKALRNSTPQTAVELSTRLWNEQRGYVTERFVHRTIERMQRYGARIRVNANEAYYYDTAPDAREPITPLEPSEPAKDIVLNTLRLNPDTNVSFAVLEERLGLKDDAYVGRICSALSADGHRVSYNSQARVAWINADTPSRASTYTHGDSDTSAKDLVLERLRKSSGTSVTLNELARYVGFAWGVTSRTVVIAAIRTLISEGHDIATAFEEAVLYPEHDEPPSVQEAPVAAVVPESKTPSIYDFGRLLAVVQTLPPESFVSEFLPGVPREATCRQWADALRSAVLTLATRSPK